VRKRTWQRENYHKVLVSEKTSKHGVVKQQSKPGAKITTTRNSNWYHAKTARRQTQALGRSHGKASKGPCASHYPDCSHARMDELALPPSSSQSAKGKPLETLGYKLMPAPCRAPASPDLKARARCPRRSKSAEQLRNHAD
jgi:hypothetical protein